MRTLRTLLTLLLCLTLPYTALASALRDPQCLQGRGAMPAHEHSTMSMPGMVQGTHDMASMPRNAAMVVSHDPHSMHSCGCLLGCACVQACAAPACNSGLDGDGGIALSPLRQESPPVPRIADRRPATPAELLRPPSLRA